MNTAAKTYLSCNLRRINCDNAVRACRHSPHGLQASSTSICINIYVVEVILMISGHSAPMDRGHSPLQLVFIITCMCMHAYYAHDYRYSTLTGFKHPPSSPSTSSLTWNFVQICVLRIILLVENPYMHTCNIRPPMNSSGTRWPLSLKKLCLHE